MKRRRDLLMALVLSLPVILFVVHHYTAHVTKLQPTGFTVDENVLYMSYAHQYLDQEKFSLFYSNPFDGDPSSPKIYIQPINFLLAAALKTGAAPGLIFSLFGILCAVFCIYTGIKILRHLLPENKYLWLIALLFTWGGGLLAIPGMIDAAISGSQADILDGIYRGDPANGWWGLNWGRNLFIPLEAFYHLLFLLTVYYILKRNWTLALILGFFVSISHPFTATTLLLILNGWIFVEKLFLKNKCIPGWFWIGVLLVSVFHFWYYLIWLPGFPEHRQLFNQYSAGWTYSLLIAIPAYCLVGLLSVFTLYHHKKNKVLADPQQRLFLLWAVISFLLSKHEWFIDPMQPIHFTRGYTWSGLFLFGFSSLVWLIGYLRRKLWLGILLIMIFLSDNILWTWNLLDDRYKTEWEGHITSDTKEVLDFLKQQGEPNDLLIGNSRLVNYLAHTYSSVNSWTSHPYNTPNKIERENLAANYLSGGAPAKEWNGRRLLIVITKENSVFPARLNLTTTKKIFENSSYVIFTP